MRFRSAEQWQAELEEILRRYRPEFAERAPDGLLNRDAAVGALRKLGFTAGEALRLLRTKGQPR